MKPSRATAEKRRLLWVVYECVAMVIGLGSLALICLSWLPVALLMQRVLPARPGRWIGRRVIAWGFRGYLVILRTLCACHFDLKGLEGLHRQGPMVVVANHPSLLDAVLVLAYLPNAVCVMKASLMDNLLFGAAARLARYVRNDNVLGLLLRCRRELDQGAQVLLFPEGTRTRHFPVDDFLQSAGLIASRAGVPVQALVIEFSTPYLGKDWPIWRRPVLPLRVSIRLGRRFEPPQDVPGFTRQLQAYFQSEVGHPQR
ncbi:lysophospholipid acyltransferase family protein [Hydrogenophaga aquatica]